MIFFGNASKKIWTACKKGDVKTMGVMAWHAVVKMWSSLLRGGASSNMCREVELPEGVVDVK